MTRATECLTLARSLGLEAAVFLSWVAEHEQQPVTPEDLFQQFSFVNEETVYHLITELSQQGLLQEGYSEGRFHFQLSHQEVKRQFGVDLTSSPSHPVKASATTELSVAQQASATFDSSVDPFLRRFKGEGNLLDNKLQALQQMMPDLLTIAMEAGLSQTEAQASLQKCLAYIQADPQKFYNKDLVGYWRYWVSNAISYQQKKQVKNNHSPFSTTGKQSAIEQHNRNLIESLLEEPHRF